MFFSFLYQAFLYSINRFFRTLTSPFLPKIFNDDLSFFLTCQYPKTFEGVICLYFGDMSHWFTLPTQTASQMNEFDFRVIQIGFSNKMSIAMHLNLRICAQRHAVSILSCEINIQLPKSNSKNKRSLKLTCMQEQYRPRMAPTLLCFVHCKAPLPL